jgi:hypothetical protein
MTPLLTSLEFAHLVWVVGDEVSALGWYRPGFRASPTGRRRLLRAADGVPIVTVVARGRTGGAVLADLVDGVVAVNFADRPESDRETLRAELIERVRYRCVTTEIGLAVEPGEGENIDLGGAVGAAAA